MTRTCVLWQRAGTIEQELRCYPPDARSVFLGDPANWLPGRMTMHGAATFRTRLRLHGVELGVQFIVGVPWTRGTSTTRRLHIELVDPPLGLAWVLPVIDGDLNLLGEQRLRLRFEGAAADTRLLSARRLSAAWVMRAVVAGVAVRLTAGTPPPPRSASADAGDEK